MALRCPLSVSLSSSVSKTESKFQVSVASVGFVPLLKNQSSINISSRIGSFSHLAPKFLEWKKHRSELKASRINEEIAHGDGKGNKEGEKSHEHNANVRGKVIYDEEKDDDGETYQSYSAFKAKTQKDGSVHDPLLMSDEERKEWRREIREVIDKYPDVEEEGDPVEKRKKMENLLANYPLVVDEDDPDWPEDADGWGFNLNQFFNKITIKNNRKDDDDENYDSDKEIVWQDDNYIRPIKDITTTEWEETVLKDISPLIIFVHNRYKRPRENDKLREELEKAVNIFWESRLPSPRCVAVDAVVEDDLASALGVSKFPELLFTKAGKILYREKAIRTAEELSKMMAFFYYGAARPPCLKENVSDGQEQIPSIS